MAIDFPWQAAPARFKVGDVLSSGVDTGRVIKVDAAANTIEVLWDEGEGGTITYPMEASYLVAPNEMEKMPWEN